MCVLHLLHDRRHFERRHTDRERPPVAIGSVLVAFWLAYLVGLAWLVYLLVRWLAAR